MDKFRDRYEAGNILASYLKDFAHKSNVIVLASRSSPKVAVKIHFSPHHQISTD
jgi:predicted phosphoribosyltransferase